MFRYSKITASLLLSAFVILATGELSGLRVHHTASVKMFHVSVDDDGEDNHGSPCRSDESPLEHAFHHCADSTGPGAKATVLSITAMMPNFSSSSLFPVLINKASSRDDFHALSRDAAAPVSDRAPPVSL